MRIRCSLQNQRCILTVCFEINDQGLMLLKRGFNFGLEPGTLRRLSPRQQHALNSKMRFFVGFVDATSAGLVKVCETLLLIGISLPFWGKGNEEDATPRPSSLLSFLALLWEIFWFSRAFCLVANPILQSSVLAGCCQLRKAPAERTEPCRGFTKRDLHLVWIYSALCLDDVAKYVVALTKNYKCSGVGWLHWCRRRHLDVNWSPDVASVPFSDSLRGPECHVCLHPATTMLALGFLTDWRLAILVMNKCLVVPLVRAFMIS